MKHERTVLPRTKKVCDGISNVQQWSVMVSVTVCNGGRESVTVCDGEKEVSVTICGGGVQISALYTSTLLSVMFHKIMIL